MNVQMKTQLTCLTLFILLGCGQAGAPVPASDPAIAATDAALADPMAQEGQLPDTANATQFPAASEHSNAVLTSTIIDAPNGTFGYDVFSDGKLFLHQTNLPGQPGNEGCKTKADAEKLAAFVIVKIKKGEMPPTVGTTELNALGILP